MYNIIFILFLATFLIILIFIFFNKNIENYDNNNNNNNDTINININKYKNIMFNNDKKNLYKIGLNDNIKILKDDCFDKCDKSNCIKMFDKKKILDKCLKCNIQKNKCFNKSIIGGNCDDCDIEKIEDKLDCYDINNFGCPNPNNINFSNGIDPYYIELNDNNINSPYNKKCVFCWNILDNI
jgi:hypothetical protein